MKKEKHYLNKVYGGHQLSRYIDVYEVSTVDCAATQYSGYKGTEVTLIDQTPAGYSFDHWNITGATLTGNNFILNNDVTAQGIYTAVPVIASARWGMLGTGDYIITGNDVSYTNARVIVDSMTTGTKVSATFIPDNTAGVNQIHDKYRWPFGGRTGYGNVTDFYVTDVTYHGYFNEVTGSQTANIKDFVFAINGNTGTNKSIQVRANHTELYYTAKYNSAHFINPVISVSNPYLDRDITATVYFTGYVYV